MKDLFRSSVIHDEFQRWLAWGKGAMAVYEGEKAVSMLVSLEKDESVCYLYRTATAKDGTVSWDNPLAFAGAYRFADRALYLSGDALGLLAGATFPLVAEAGGSMLEEIRGSINERVEDIISNDRNNLPVREITGAMARSDLDYYRQHGARQDAIRMLFDGEAPDGKFHSDYAMEYLPEKDFLAYIQDPEGFVRTKAEEYIAASQERFLMRFLKDDALMEEYRALMEDAGNPIHRMKAITDAVKASGAKTVAVTVRKDGRELAFRTEAYSLAGHQGYYSAYHIQASDRRKFKELFGQHADYGPDDIIRISYGRKAIYEAPSCDAGKAGPA